MGSPLRRGDFWTTILTGEAAPEFRLVGNRTLGDHMMAIPRGKNGDPPVVWWFRMGLTSGRLLHPTKPQKKPWHLGKTWMNLDGWMDGFGGSLRTLEFWIRCYNRRDDRTPFRWHLKKFLKAWWWRVAQQLNLPQVSGHLSTMASAVWRRAQTPDVFFWLRCLLLVGLSVIISVDGRKWRILTLAGIILGSQPDERHFANEKGVNSFFV